MPKRQKEVSLYCWWEQNFCIKIHYNYHLGAEPFSADIQSSGHKILCLYGTQVFITMLTSHLEAFLSVKDLILHIPVLCQHMALNMSAHRSAMNRLTCVVKVRRFLTVVGYLVLLDFVRCLSIIKL